MRKILGKTFFDRDTLVVAEELIGKYLVGEIDGKKFAKKIIETEAYDGFLDMASHARAGKTERTRIMYEEAGHIYVYLVYGMHELLNIITGPEEYPAGVLIRGVEGLSGPARLTKALGITRKLNGLKLGKKAGLWIEDRGEIIDKKRIMRTPRIGVAYAGEEWAGKLYRFIVSEKKKPPL